MFQILEEIRHLIFQSNLVVLLPVFYTSMGGSHTISGEISYLAEVWASFLTFNIVYKLLYQVSGEPELYCNLLHYCNHHLITCQIKINLEMIQKDKTVITTYDHAIR